MWHQDPHDKPEWKLIGNNKWRIFERKVAGMNIDLMQQQRNMKDGLSKRKMRQIRRKQFFGFFEGFFEKHNKESLKLKAFDL